MNLLLRHKLYRVLAAANFFNRFGASIYNLVFVVYASLMPQPELAVGLANVIVFVPSIFSIFIGMQADRTQQKMKWLVTFGFLQTLLFLLVGLLSGSLTWLAFSCVCLINLMSDMISDYRGGLEMPIFQHNIAEEDLMEAYSFNQFISFVCMLGGQAFGVWLLSLSQNRFGLVAVINALCFLLSSVILYLNRQSLSHPPVVSEDKGLAESFRDIFKNLEQVFQSQQEGSLLLTLTCVLLVNALGGALVAMYNIYFLRVPFADFSYSTSIFLIQAMMMGGMIVGSLTPNDFFGKADIFTILKGASLLLALLGLFNSLRLPHLLSFLVIAFLFYLSGKVNPKIDSLLMANVPSHMLAQTSSALAVLSIAAMPLGTAVFSALVVWNLSVSWLIFTGLALVCLLLLSFKSKKG
ncbi:MFS transporter [Streptococcus cuniculipharyngis]|uniref:MFS transporter n=1 Tax=Streptococcus cuniculipharyngis TaxID=1562651 RepID=A0A5C5SFN9_9STRE|nr:MFS transporter [Streptococcus cuniculipharyngis]TWS99112.1 MFS transporter [Streptococcus cuniculipharyngis]